MSLRGWSTCYLLQPLSWAPHSVLRLEHRARRTKVVRDAPQCNEKTQRTSLTLNFSRQSYGQRFLKRPKTRDHINSTGGEESENLGLILVLHIDPEPFFLTLLFYLFVCLPFPVLKNPTMVKFDEICFNMMIQSLMNLFLNGCFLKINPFIF